MQLSEKIYGGSGTSTSAINVGGVPYPMTCEQWNGTTWATFANYNGNSKN